MGNHERPTEHTRRKVLEYALIAGGLAAGGYPVYRYRNVLFPSESKYPPLLPASVDVGKLPDTLPPAVAVMQHAIVQIHNDADNVTLSGVVLDSHHVLTAGHGFRGISGGLLPLAGCKGETVITGRDAKGNKIDDLSAKIVSAYTQNNYSIPDVCLIETQGSLEALTYPRPVLPSPQPVKNGNPLFFINYERTFNNFVRDPYSDTLEIYDPAIFGGIAFDTWNGDITVKLGKNYGDGIPDTKIRGGASGGAVFDEKGYLVGISVDAARKDYEAIVLPVTPDLIAGLYTNLRNNPDACHI
jgi:hypothetical protein